MQTFLPGKSSEQKLTFGLYIHWPFCLRKCPYCDFNSFSIAGGEIDHVLWTRALLQALNYEACRASFKNRVLTSVFFGGGTPSLMQPRTIAVLLEKAVTYWSSAEKLEVTLEANPCTVNRDYYKELKAAGINRLSLGIQSLDDIALHWLGRSYTANQAIAAFDLARRFFPHLSFDLIYARPRQTLATWRHELEQAVELESDHMSLYQLTVEKESSFLSMSSKEKTILPGEEIATNLYCLTQDITATANLPSYEISNHARIGSESKHNLAFWKGGDVVGIGPGAHGRLTISNNKILAMKHKDTPRTWLRRLKSANHCLTSYLSSQEYITDLFLTGLRLTDGIDCNLFENLTNCKLTDILDPLFLITLREFIVLDKRSLRVTMAGRLVLNEVLRQLLLSLKKRED